MSMQHNNPSFNSSNNNHHNIIADNPFDYMSLAGSPAEADMLRFLTLYCLNNEDDMFHHKHLPRLKQKTPWDFYDAIYQSDSHQSPNILHKICETFTQLKFENDFSLNPTEKDLAPYHPRLNNLPPLIIPNPIIDFKTLICLKITEAQPYLKLNYLTFTTNKHLKEQIDLLNTLSDRNARLDTMVYVKRIQEHAFFNHLNGQRGVFAKTDIPAGTIIDYYSGEYAEYPAPMPPTLCTWRIVVSHSYLSYLWKSRKISRFNGWTDAFILGNMMKLVNSCYSNYFNNPDIGNIGCYFFHFKAKNHYLSLPVYVSIKDIPKDSELLTFYHVGAYRNNRIYGVDI
jgi:hypothetical protein